MYRKCEHYIAQKYVYLPDMETILYKHISRVKFIEIHEIDRIPVLVLNVDEVRTLICLIKSVFIQPWYYIRYRHGNFHRSVIHMKNRK